MGVMWREKDTPPCGCREEKFRACEEEVDGDEGDIDPSVPGPLRPIFANEVSKSLGTEKLTKGVFTIHTA